MEQLTTQFMNEWPSKPVPLSYAYAQLGKVIDVAGLANLTILITQRSAVLRPCNSDD